MIKHPSVCDKEREKREVSRQFIFPPPPQDLGLIINALSQLQ